MNINLKSVFWMCKYLNSNINKLTIDIFAIPHMIKQQKGVIVNNASIQGIHSQPNVPAYAATKGGMLSLTRQLAVEYGKYNIRVNAVRHCQTVIITSHYSQNWQFMAKSFPLFVTTNYLR